MRIALILDPLEGLKVAKDTSIALMRAAAQRGHAIFAAAPGDLCLRAGKVVLRATPLTIRPGMRWYRTGKPALAAPSSFDAVLIRKDPPFDSEYLYCTYLLDSAVLQGARVFNRPGAIRDWNEKLSIARFPQFAPEFLVTSQRTLIREFLRAHGDIVVKPLDGMGGRNVFRLHAGDHNIGAILEVMTHYDQRTVMAQRYLPEIAAGDKRILVVDGTPLPYALARIPQAGETRGNLAAGGTGVAQPLSERDREIATVVGRVLKQEGLFLAGLDVIGNHLTEINVTSPTGMVEIAAQTGYDPAVAFMDMLERACT